MYKMTISAVCCIKYTTGMKLNDMKRSIHTLMTEKLYFTSIEAQYNPKFGPYRNIIGKLLKMP